MLIVGEGAVGGEVKNPRLGSAEMEDWLCSLPPPLWWSGPTKYGPLAIKMQLLATDGTRDRKHWAVVTVGRSHLINHTKATIRLMHINWSDFMFCAGKK